jgi:hypothetical protein
MVAGEGERKAAKLKQGWSKGAEGRKGLSKFTFLLSLFYSALFQVKSNT